MFNKILLSTVALGALAGTAFAADLPSRRRPPVYVAPPPIPVFTWTGFYVGGQVGYEFGSSNAYVASRTGAGISSASVNSKGVIGGAHVGYNFSTQSLGIGNIGGFGLGTGGLVLGVEGDVDGSNYKANYLLGALSDSTRQDIQGSVRGRLGVAFDRVLVYGTGGVAFGGLTNNYALNGLNTSLSHTRVGWTVGGGVEYALSNNWSVRGEYRYTDFGSFTDQVGPVSVRHHETDNRVQGGFSYKFDTFVPAAVVARY